MITTDTIVEYLKNAVEQKIPIPPTVWLDSAVKLNLLLSDEQAELFDLEQKVSLMRLNLLQEDDKRNVSAAKLIVEASDEYKAQKNQKAKIDRIIEFIRLAKVHSRISAEEMRGY